VGVCVLLRCGLVLGFVFCSDFVIVLWKCGVWSTCGFDVCVGLDICRFWVVWYLVVWFGCLVLTIAFLFS